MAAPVRSCRDRKVTNGQTREFGSSQQSTANAHAEGTLEMRPLRYSVGMSLDPTKDQSPLMGPSTFDL